jgi:hypothetical protein
MEAMMGPDSVKWLDAIKSGIVSMYENQVWNLVDPPEGVKHTERKWNYKVTDVDINIHERLDLSKNEFTTKFKELTTKGLDL